MGLFLFISLPEVHSQVFYGAPAWSPVRDEVLYVSNEKGNQDLYVIDVSTRAIRQLTFHEAEEGAPSWSADGESILFISDRDGNKEIYRMTREGHHIRRLTHTPMHEASPVFTPDMHYIAYCYFGDQPDSTFDNSSHLMTSEGRYERALGPTSYFNLYPKYSVVHPNLILMTGKLREKGSRNGVFLYNTTTHILRPLSGRGHVTYNGKWSPEGKHVVYVKQRDSSLASASLYVVDVATGKETEVFTHPSGVFQPTFSHDGKQLVFRKGWKEGHEGLGILGLTNHTADQLVGPDT